MATPISNQGVDSPHMYINTLMIMPQRGIRRMCHTCPCYTRCLPLSSAVFRWRRHWRLDKCLCYDMFKF